jgi:hypothetical protein
MPGSPVSGASTANTGGDGTVTPQSAVGRATLTITGGAGTRNIILSTSPIGPDWRLVVLLLLPATANINLVFRNGSAGGTIITSVLTDGSGNSAVLEFYAENGAWNYLRAQIPA